MARLLCGLLQGVVPWRVCRHTERRGLGWGQVEAVDSDGEANCPGLLGVYEQLEREGNWIKMVQHPPPRAPQHSCAARARARTRARARRVERRFERGIRWTLQGSRSCG
jgi:hypothetical protein